MDDTTTVQVDVTDDAAVEAYLVELDEKMDALDPGPATQEEWERLGDEASALRKKRDEHKKLKAEAQAEVQRQHAERTKGMREAIKSLNSEATAIADKLAAADLAPPTRMTCAHVRRSWRPGEATSKQPSRMQGSRPRIYGPSARLGSWSAKTPGSPMRQPWQTEASSPCWLGS